ncbi:Zn-dependent hydrolase, glyoxylase [Burkholderiales bacterium JOSHI_001]|nr:Zn-dependent hydrolase, glyoxylase [Burkholderiales bacterium JOSHI_001]
MTGFFRWWLGLGLFWALAGCAALGPGGDTVSPRRVAPGVYILPGLPGEPEVDNGGRIGNVGFIVGPRGVVVVNSGTSYAHGQAVLKAIARVTDQPVKLLLLTHVHQEFVFGAAAFQARGIPVALHEDAARLMASRCENCLRSLKRLLGEPAMAGTRVVKAERRVVNGQVLDDIGRAVRVLHFGHSSGPGDIAVLDESTGTLFAGGLADVGQVPDIQDSRLPAWRQALAALGLMGLRTVVPGHGPAAEAGAALAATGRYLDALESTVRRLLAADTALSDVSDAAELPAFADWDRYATVHRRNASVLFVRFEAEALMAAPAQKPSP